MLVISTCYSSYSFHLICAKFMRTLITIGQYSQAIISLDKFQVSRALGQGQVSKALWDLIWNHNMGVDAKILKCWISRKWLTVEWNGSKFGISCTTLWLQVKIIWCNFLNFWCKWKSLNLEYMKHGLISNFIQK